MGAKQKVKSAAMAKGIVKNDFTDHFLIHFGFHWDNCTREAEHDKKYARKDPTSCVKLNGKTI